MSVDAGQGLSEAEATARRQESGPNELEHREVPPDWRLFLEQFESPLVLVLIAGVVVSAVIGEVVDAIAISVIVGLNGIIGFFQERRAEHAMAALSALTARRATVIRDGRPKVIPAAEIVPGDLLELSPGDVVAADARLVEAQRLSVDEASLTGESLPVRKSTEPVEPGAPVAERTDHVFMGTSVATGTGRAVVDATGMRTQMGEIAARLSRETSKTPLERRLEELGRALLITCVGLVLVVAGLGWWHGVELEELMLSSVSLMVAAVPEGLPAVITIALAVGMQRMASHDVLVRRLGSVETLGSVTVICTDKTGTLTTGRMEARELWGPDRTALLRAAAACCDADLHAGTGDPTELALLRAASEEGIERTDIERDAKRLRVEPFDAASRRMWIERADGRVYVKGALEVILPYCTERDGAVAANEAMAGRGLRVLAVADGPASGLGDDGSLSGLTLRGLAGLADPPRPEASKAIEAARRAGIRTLMITGDHPVTAHAIARELGLIREGEDPERTVRARTTAGEKDDIVRELKARGEIVAMTGDGVNDAPAIRESDIGIAMGETATEVTREASDMILTKDDLGSVVTAIREGRVIYDNIRRTVVYLLGGNFAELVFVLLTAAAGLPLPLAPLHLLWINLMTESLPALALVIEPAADDVLARPPRPPQEALMGRAQWVEVLIAATLLCIIPFGLFVWALEAEGLENARSLAFSTLVFGVSLRAFALRHDRRSVFELGFLSNTRLLLVVLFVMAVQVGLYLVPQTRSLFELGQLTAADLGLALGLGAVPVVLLGAIKLVRRAAGRGDPAAS